MGVYTLSIIYIYIHIRYSWDGSESPISFWADQMSMWVSHPFLGISPFIELFWVLLLLRIWTQYHSNPLSQVIGYVYIYIYINSHTWLSPKMGHPTLFKYVQVMYCYVLLILERKAMALGDPNDLWDTRKKIPIKCLAFGIPQEDRTMKSR